MRKLTIALVIAMLVMGLVNIATHAQSTLREYTGYQVMNLATCAGCDAHVRVDYYGPTGVTPVFTRQLPNIPPKGSFNVQQKTEDGLPDGVYSAVLSSDQPIAAIVAQNESDPAVPGAGGSVAPFSNYTGASAGATSVKLPVIMSNWFGFDTLVRLQNVGGDTATVNIQYIASNSGGANPTGAANIPMQTYTVPRYAAITRDQSAEQAVLGATTGSNLNRFIGSAVITSTQPLVAVVNQTNATLRRKMTYNGFGPDDGGEVVLAPSIYSRWFNTFTSLTVQNTGESPVTVRIAYKAAAQSLLVGGADGNGRTHEVSFTLAAGQSSTRYEGSAAGGDLWGVFTRFGGSARITATGGSIVATVNQERSSPLPIPGRPNGGSPAGTYNAVPVNRGTLRVAAPLIQANFYNFYTGLTCANTNPDQDTIVDIEYTSDTLSISTNTTQTFSHTIRAGSSILRYEEVRNGTLADINRDGTNWTNGRNLFNGSAFITSRTHPIICTVNEQTNGVEFDNLNIYNAINLSGN